MTNAEQKQDDKFKNEVLALVTALLEGKAPVSPSQSAVATDAETEKGGNKKDEDDE